MAKVTIEAWHGGEIDGARWFTTDRSHAAYFGDVHRVTLTSGIEPVRINAADLDLPADGGYEADAALIAHMDSIDCTWAIVSGWEGSGDCIVIRERQYVRVEEQD